MSKIVVEGSIAGEHGHAKLSWKFECEAPAEEYDRALAYCQRKAAAVVGIWGPITLAIDALEANKPVPRVPMTLDLDPEFRIVRFQGEK